jgi:hypothetical protein
VAAAGKATYWSHCPAKLNHHTYSFGGGEEKRMVIGVAMGYMGRQYNLVLPATNKSHGYGKSCG